MDLILSKKEDGLPLKIKILQERRFSKEMREDLLQTFFVKRTPWRWDWSQYYKQQTDAHSREFLISEIILRNFTRLVLGMSISRTHTTYVRVGVPCRHIMFAIRRIVDKNCAIIKTVVKSWRDILCMQNGNPCERKAGTIHAISYRGSITQLLDKKCLLHAVLQYKMTYLRQKGIILVHVSKYCRFFRSCCAKILTPSSNNTKILNVQKLLYLTNVI